MCDWLLTCSFGTMFYLWIRHFSGSKYGARSSQGIAINRFINYEAKSDRKSLQNIQNLLPTSCDFLVVYWQKFIVRDMEQFFNLFLYYETHDWYKVFNFNFRLVSRFRSLIGAVCRRKEQQNAEGKFILKQNKSIPFQKFQFKICDFSSCQWGNFMFSSGNVSNFVYKFV